MDSPGELDSHGAVALHPDQAQVRQRTPRHGGTFAARVDREGGARFEVLSKHTNQVFCFSNDDMIGFEFHGRQAACDRSTDNCSETAGTAAAHDREQIGLLHVHPADQDNVSPGKIRVFETFDIGINQPLAPGVRQKSGDRHQTQRWLGGTLALERQRVPEAPIRIGKFGIDQQNFHWNSRLGRTAGRGGDRRRALRGDLSYPRVQVSAFRPE